MAQRFDLVVVGSGSGLDVANACVEEGWRVAIVEEGPLGGTCLNRGCIPSKLLLHSADVAETLRRAPEFGIVPQAMAVDFPRLVRRVTRSVDGDSQGIEAALKELDNPRLFQGRGRFVGPKRLRVAGKDGAQELEAEHWLMATGARPTIPPIPGLRDVPFLTSTEALRLERQPRSIVILGGGYIAAELAHHFGALGSKVSIVQRRNLLLRREDGEVAATYTRVAQERYEVWLDSEATAVRKGGAGVQVDLRTPQGPRTLDAEHLLLAVGVTPNSDTLGLDQAGIAVDKEGFLEVDKHLMTNVPGVYALGDALGRHMYKHAANWEAGIVIQNLLRPQEKAEAIYPPMPHAVFGSPQVAGVGATQEELEEIGRPYLVGKQRYRDTAMGHALEEEHGFAKLLVDPRTGAILGAHILGPSAADLLHIVLAAMGPKGLGTINDLQDIVYIHPAMAEVVQRASYNLQEPHGHDHGDEDGEGHAEGEPHEHER
jgi:mycothione reductase